MARQDSNTHAWENLFPRGDLSRSRIPKTIPKFDWSKHAARLCSKSMNTDELTKKNNYELNSQSTRDLVKRDVKRLKSAFRTPVVVMRHVIIAVLVNLSSCIPDNTDINTTEYVKRLDFMWIHNHSQGTTYECVKKLVQVLCAIQDTNKKVNNMWWGI